MFSCKRGMEHIQAKREEVNKTGGGLAPKPPSDSVMKIVEVYDGHPKFEGIDGSFTTFKGPELSIESNDLHTIDSIDSS